MNQSHCRRQPTSHFATQSPPTLQSPEWIEHFSAKPGAHVPLPLDLVEMGLPAEMQAAVVAVEPCPRLEPPLAGKDPGRLVLTTVNHLHNDVWELAAIDAHGRREQLRPTGPHRFYSDTRHDWVAAKDIHDNEVIRGRPGPLTITAKRQLSGTQRVYNLTVEGEHVYYVSHLGLLAHNNCNEEEMLFRGVPGNDTEKARLGRQGVAKPRGTALDYGSLEKHVRGEQVDAGVVSFTRNREAAKRFSGRNGTIIEVPLSQVKDRIVARPNVGKYGDEYEVLIRGVVTGTPTTP